MFNVLALALPVIQSIFYALIVLIIGLFIIKWITKRVNQLIDKKGLDPTLKPFIKSVVNVGLKLLLIVAIIGILGIDTTSFVALFGAVGLAAGLAFQGSLSNFAGGMLILITRPFKVGDFVETSGYIGTVEAIRILYTDIITLDNRVVRIPNGGLANTSLVNYSEKETRRVDLQFAAGYDTDFRKVISLITDVVSNHPLTLKDPEPFVRMSEHGKSAVIYTVRVWVKSENYWDVYFDLIEKVKERFDAEGFSIPYRQMDIHVKNIEKVEQ